MLKPGDKVTPKRMETAISHSVRYTSVMSVLFYNKVLTIKCKSSYNFGYYLMVEDSWKGNRGGEGYLWHPDWLTVLDSKWEQHKQRMLNA